MAKGVKWTAIVLTCPQAEWSPILQRELDLRQAKGQIDKDVFLLTVEDPKLDVGSGGATINALLTVAEYISAQKGYAVLNESVLQDSRILILHNGRPYSYDTCGRPFTTLPAKYTDPNRDGLVCLLDALITLITEQLATPAGPGVWVSSTDMVLTLPRGAKIPWVPCDACAFTVPALPAYCKNHGVYKLDEKGFVEDILYKETIKNMEVCERPDGTLPLVCGLVYLSVPVSEKLLSFFTKPPLDACTYFGVDSGEPPIQLSLFFDVMLPMCSKVNVREFRSGARSGSYGKQGLNVGNMKTMRMARTILWDDLHQYRIKACMLEDGNCLYPHTVKDHKMVLMDEPIRECFSEGALCWSNVVHSHIQSEKIDESAVIINSILGDHVTVGPKTLVTHSCLHGDISISKESFIGGLNTKNMGKCGPVEFADSIIVQGQCVYLPMIDRSIQVVTTHGRFDTIEMPMWKSTATFCNAPWLVFMNRTGIVKEDLWGQDMDTDSQNIFTARMFPVVHARDKVGLTEILWLQGVINDDIDRQILNRWRESYRLSLKDILLLTNLKEELESRRQLFYSVGQCDITQALKHSQNLGFRSLYNCAVIEGYTDFILHTLDSVCEESTNQLQAGVAARTLANIADVLGCMAGPKGGLRSGPAANVMWSKAFQLLEEGEIKAGVAALAQERSNWLDRPDKLIRAARHYEGAAQILIRHAVMTAKEFFSPAEEFMIKFGQWALAECPARIDVSGGWSDTPPITYEHGGAVCIVGLLINGQRPIGAKTRRIQEPWLVLVIHGGSETKDVVCKELSDLRDYYQPHSTGALLKAAFVCADIVDLTSSMSLADQLTMRYGGGFEVHSWSNLPHGSGMGASSILAGAVMASILKAAGKSCGRKGLVHSVLYLEQLLTTGGGWQDQVGGLFGGVTLGLSDAQLPLYVDVKNVKVTPGTIQAFNDRLVLIYTGKTRLARNLLQDVVRNWYARNPQIVETEDCLVKLATDCARFFEKDDLEAVGLCMDSYWQMKKKMAPSCEPEVVTRIMNALRPHALGMCMAGAGGGGFMYVLAKDANARDQIVQLLADMKAADGVEVYEACIDQDGMQVAVVEEEEEEEEEEEDMTEYYNQPETLLDEPSEGSGAKTVETDAVKTNEENVKQAEGDIAGQGDEVKVTEKKGDNCEDGKKSESLEPAKSAESETDKSAESEPAKSDDSEPAKLDESEPAKSAESEAARIDGTGEVNDGGPELSESVGNAVSNEMGNTGEPINVVKPETDAAQENDSTVVGEVENHSVKTSGASAQDTAETAKQETVTAGEGAQQDAAEHNSAENEDLQE